MVLILVCAKSYSQKQAFKAPDYELIKKEIQDKSSNYYYPKLLNRLVANDTLLTNEAMILFIGKDIRERQKKVNKWCKF